MDRGLVPTTTTLCGIVKNEGHYLLEWIAFHKVVGFTEMLIYDNGSSDGSELLLSRLSAAGEINHVIWPDRQGVAPQRAAYMDSLSKVKTEWICFLDADEFLNLKRDSTVSDFLTRFPGTVGAVALNWRIFGSSGLKRAGQELVIDRFTRCSPANIHVNHHIKTIARAKNIAEMHIHRCFLGEGSYVNACGKTIEIERLGFSPSVETEAVQINHYVVKSEEEYALKRLRGNVNRPPESLDKYAKISEEFFRNHDQNQEEDKTILRFRADTISYLNRLQDIAR